MSTKSQQLQIRVTPQQKARLKRRAKAAGLDLSTFVLAQALPSAGDRFAEIVRALRVDAKHAFALAELNDYLHTCTSAEFSHAVVFAESGALRGLSPYLQNYVAAMTEQAAHQKGAVPPAWTRDIAPLGVPHFATPLAGLRAHLLRSAPVPFKRRNIFVDASVGDRV